MASICGDPGDDAAAAADATLLRIASTGNAVSTRGFTLPELHEYDHSNDDTITATAPQVVAQAECHNDAAVPAAPETPPVTLMTAVAASAAASGPNGSLITMTMKNNQLIVETEERNVSGDVVLTASRQTPREHAKSCLVFARRCDLS